ncbi:UNVERIFIED_CONTAM: hypothetical protein HDU68_007245 [Siphonaria sp. JEL0065]|nr:hypothetical protein HDU68_007245 [Siphonaria sp. JEL0065]
MKLKPRLRVNDKRIISALFAGILCLAALIRFLFVHHDTHHNVGSRSDMEAIHRVMEAMPNDFTLYPPISPTHPLKKHAVITSLLHQTNLLNPNPPRELDPQALSAFLQTHIFTKNNASTNPRREYEFLVLIHKRTPPRYKTFLLSLGARLLMVPAIEILGTSPHGPILHNSYTVLQLWKLDGVFDVICYIHHSIFFTDVHKERLDPVAGVKKLLKVYEDYEREHAGKYFFAAVKDVARSGVDGAMEAPPPIPSSGAANEGGGNDGIVAVATDPATPAIVYTGVMLFKPSSFHFDMLYERAQRIEVKGDENTGEGKVEAYSNNLEHGVISRYFLDEEKDAGWFVELDTDFNVGDLSWLTRDEEIALKEEEGGAMLGVQQVYWDQKGVNGSLLMFEWWSVAMRELRNRQIDMYKLYESNYEVDLHMNTDAELCMVPVIPVVPSSLEEWELVRESGIMYDSIAILSAEVTSNEFLLRRDALANNQQQADHFVFSLDSDFTTDPLVIEPAAKAIAKLGAKTTTKNNKNNKKSPDSPPPTPALATKNLQQKGSVDAAKSTRFLEILAKASKILSEYEYDWVWYIPDKTPIILSEKNILLHASIGEAYKAAKRKSIIMFEQDCTGGFLMRRRVNEKLAQFVWDAQERAKFSVKHTYDAQIMMDFKVEFETYIAKLRANDVRSFPFGDCIPDYL